LQAPGGKRHPAARRTAVFISKFLFLLRSVLLGRSRRSGRSWLRGRLNRLRLLLILLLLLFLADLPRLGHSLLEFNDPLPNSAHERRYLRRAEKEQDDEEYEQKFRNADVIEESRNHKDGGIKHGFSSKI
jgi:hypothetical protein